MTTVRVREIPVEVVEVLTRRAERAGLQFDDYVTRLVVEMADEQEQLARSAEK